MFDVAAGGGPKHTPLPKFKKKTYWIDKNWRQNNDNVSMNAFAFLRWFPNQ
jgi:hypothetical protein